jgi:hypothetical protein
MKSVMERMDINAAYREVGTYRGAADICGTTPKTVKRVVVAAERAEPVDVRRNCDDVCDVVVERVAGPHGSRVGEGHARSLRASVPRARRGDRLWSERPLLACPAAGRARRASAGRIRTARAAEALSRLAAQSPRSLGGCRSGARPRWRRSRRRPRCRWPVAAVLVVVRQP